MSATQFTLYVISTHVKSACLHLSDIFMRLTPSILVG